MTWYGLKLTVICVRTWKKNTQKIKNIYEGGYKGSWLNCHTHIYALTNHGGGALEWSCEKT